MTRQLGGKEIEMSGFCAMCGAQGHHEVWCEVAKKPKTDRYDLPRWLLETHNDKRSVWQQEATWHDGFSLRGTPRIERAVLEGRALVDEGFSARITDLRTGRIFYPAQWEMLAPNLLPPNADVTGLAPAKEVNHE